MLNERLRLAKQLLKEDGVIFVSIDDSEQAYLKVLMDEIFGEENFISVFKWIRTYTPASLSSKVRKKMEYVLCYEKKRNNREYNVGTITGGDMPLLNDTNNKKELSFITNTMWNLVLMDISKKVYMKKLNWWITLTLKMGIRMLILF